MTESHTLSPAVPPSGPIAFPSATSRILPKRPPSVHAGDSEYTGKNKRPQDRQGDTDTQGKVKREKAREGRTGLNPL